MYRGEGTVQAEEAERQAMEFIRQPRNRTTVDRVILCPKIRKLSEKNIQNLPKGLFQTYSSKDFHLL
uniref:Uncharacterized protein n=1 Tax=Acrobeloides nanus TaxID=290746 RepID=A0A914CGC3_9BILA